MLMDKWEGALAVRDSVFVQVFLLALLAYVVYRYLPPSWQQKIFFLAVMLFVGLYVGSVLNIILWQP
jgi:hypothetical protein